MSHNSATREPIKILACSPNPGLSKDAALSTSDGREPSRNEAPLKTIDLGFKQRYRSRREPETFRSSRKAMVAITQQAIRMVGICHRYRSARAAFTAYRDRWETLKMELATAYGVAALSSPAR